MFCSPLIDYSSNLGSGLFFISSTEEEVSFILKVSRRPPGGQRDAIKRPVAGHQTAKLQTSCDSRLAVGLQ